jgi:hypothetical protein
VRSVEAAVSAGGGANAGLCDRGGLGSYGLQTVVADEALTHPRHHPRWLMYRNCGGAPVPEESGVVNRRCSAMRSAASTATAPPAYGPGLPAAAAAPPVASSGVSPAAAIGAQGLGSEHALEADNAT